MSKDQTAKSSATKTNPTKILLLGALGTGPALFNIMGGGEAPSFAIRALEYLFLGCGLVALAGGLDHAGKPRLENRPAVSVTEPPRKLPRWRRRGCLWRRGCG